MTSIQLPPRRGHGPLTTICPNVTTLLTEHANSPWQQRDERSLPELFGDHGAAQQRILEVKKGAELERELEVFRGTVLRAKPQVTFHDLFLRKVETQADGMSARRCGMGLFTPPWTMRMLLADTSFALASLRHARFPCGSGLKPMRQPTPQRRSALLKRLFVHSTSRRPDVKVCILASFSSSL